MQEAFFDLGGLELPPRPRKEKTQSFPLMPGCGSCQECQSQDTPTIVIEFSWFFRDIVFNQINHGNKLVVPDMGGSRFWVLAIPLAGSVAAEELIFHV